jgi:hypothetical protein
VAGQQDQPGAVEMASGDLAQRMERLPPGHPSSPYEEDGARRPPVTRSADRELPLPDEQDADAEPALHQPDEPDQRSLDTQDLSRQEAVRPDAADRDAADHEIGEGEAGSGEIPHGDTHDSVASSSVPTSPDASRSDSRSWWQVLPHLKEEWEHHKERWPQEQHPPIDRSTDEPGSWRGDSGRCLSARDNAHVDTWCDRIVKAEEHITSRVEDIERASAGVLAGKDFRLKERDRLKDKVAALREDAASDADPDHILEDVHDAVRYTLQYGDSDYTEAVQSDVTWMKDHGFNLVRLKNFWEDREYKGINSQWRDRETSQIFEMQFHTSASFEAKQITHKAYERLNSVDIADEESSALDSYQREVSSVIPIPNGAKDIPEYP